MGIMFLNLFFLTEIFLFYGNLQVISKLNFKMNSIQKSIEILIDLLYLRDENGSLRLQDLIDGPFLSFTKVERSEFRVKRIIIKKMTSKFGEDVMFGSENRKSRKFKISNRFLLDEASYITSAISEEFENVTDLQEHLTGSVVTFRRLAPRPFSAQYLHTGVLLRTTSGSIYVLELNKEPGLFGLFEQAKVGMNLAEDVLTRGRNPSGGSIRVVNTHLKKRGVNISQLLYRTSRIFGLPMTYHMESMNCDVITQFLVTGNPKWFNDSPGRESLKKVPSFMMKWSNGITLNILKNIENELNEAEATEEQN
jgi:hypothetical protein